MNGQNRNKIIVRTSLIGIVTNVLLAAVKATVGLLANSIAVVLDAVNNLSDALSRYYIYFFFKAVELYASFCHFGNAFLYFKPGKRSPGRLCLKKQGDHSRAGPKIKAFFAFTHACKSRKQNAVQAEAKALFILNDLVAPVV